REVPRSMKALALSTPRLHESCSRAQKTGLRPRGPTAQAGQDPLTRESERAVGGRLRSSGQLGCFTSRQAEALAKTSPGPECEGRGAIRLVGTGWLKQRVTGVPDSHIAWQIGRNLSPMAHSK